MKIRKGIVLKDKNTGRIVVIKGRATGNKHWNCICGKKNHRIHEGTLRKYYEPI